MRILNEIVSRFDMLCLEYGIEKIKMVGNTFMGATGINEKDQNDSIQHLADFCFALKEKIIEINKIFSQNYSLRIGLEMGPLVAGVIGKKKV